MFPRPFTSLVIAWMAALAFPAAAQADIPADYAAIIGSTAGTASDGYGSPGSIPVHGRAAFPVLIDTNNVPALAAGRYGHGVSPDAARAVAAGHTGFINTSGTSTTSQLFLNSVLWTSRKATRGEARIASTSSSTRTFLQNQGFLVQSITNSVTAAQLANCHVLVANLHDTTFSAGAISAIQQFAADGGGIVFACTPWALDTARVNHAQAILEPFGLSISGDGTASGSFTVAANSYPVFHSALPALDLLLADATGGPTMTLANKRIAAGAVDRVLAVRPGHPELTAALNALEVPYGLIQVTAAQPLVKNNRPVEAMLARHQSARFDAMVAGDLIVHPSASDWPGSPAAAGPTVSRTFTVNGNVPPDSYINWGDRGRRIETRLYAAPGATVTVTIPANRVNSGLRLDIGCHIDVNFHLGTWRRFPKVTRGVPLTQTVTHTGNVFGGLIWINIPAGANLGTFDVTISGALEAPCFQLGVDTDEDWVSTLRNLPGAWGCIMTENVPAYGNTPAMTIYVSRNHLRNLDSAEAVALHWKKVIETADHYMGYGPFRKRGESALSDRDIIAGGGHAGYPVMMAYGDSDSLINGTVKNGDWGFYHELGHTYQDSFDGTYGIATHGEVDVNLVPALLYTHVHDRTPWDGTVHSTYSSGNRLTRRTEFLARPAADRTWDFACSDGATAYDFYFNLAEAFGWDVYRIALGRLMAWQQGASDPALQTLSGTSAQARRNRFYTIFCDAAGRNLDAYFQRYGLGVTGLGHEISAAAKSSIAAKGYPVWTDNSPVDEILDPGPISISENAPPGSLVAALQAIDPEEPGTIWTWTIVSGNTGGRFTLDRRSGELRVSADGLDYETAAAYNLLIRAQDGGLPRFQAERTIHIEIGNVVEPPSGTGFIVLSAASGTAAGTILGQGITADGSLSLASAAIVSGNASGAFAVDALGRVVLQNPSALPATSLVTLVLSGTDTAGSTGFAVVRVLANASPGLREQRWSGQTRFNNNNWTGTPNPSYTGNISSANTAQNVGNSYSRRVTGWLVAPVSGDYTFWISSDDDSRFYLGAGAEEATKSQRASVSGWTTYQNFDANPAQQSASIPLVAGRAYWFEMQQTDGGGDDHLTVAWQRPGGAREVVPGAFLIPNQPGIAVTDFFPQAPAFLSPPLTLDDATEGNAYTGALAGSAADPNDGETLVFSKTGGPGWLDIAADGSLSGTPADADGGPNEWTVRVTDPTGMYAETQLSIHVIPVDEPPPTAFRQWQLDTFGEDVDDPDVSGPDADPDDDGLTNLEEYAFGTPPKSPSVRPIEAGFSGEGEDKGFRVTILRDPAATGIAFIVEVTSTLDDPESWDTAGLVIEEDLPDRLVVRDTTASDRRFFRVRLVLEE